jgi:protein-disulfide isomerase
MTRGTATAHLVVPITGADHVLGSESANVTLVEYGDYQCPSCGEAYPIVKELMSQLDRQLLFVFRNFPLATVHPHAETAAEAAEAAGTQGQFWEMHDMLFENQDALDNEDIVQYAAALGLDETRFIRDLAGHANAARVREDFLGGVRSGVNGTPTFFINGARHDGAYDFDTLSMVINDELSSSA